MSKDEKNPNDWIWLVATKYSIWRTDPGVAENIPGVTKFYHQKTSYFADWVKTGTSYISTGIRMTIEDGSEYARSFLMRPESYYNKNGLYTCSITQTSTSTDTGVTRCIYLLSYEEDGIRYFQPPELDVSTYANEWSFNNPYNTKNLNIKLTQKGFDSSPWGDNITNLELWSTLHLPDNAPIGWDGYKSGYIFYRLGKLTLTKPTWRREYTFIDNGNTYPLNTPDRGDTTKNIYYFDDYNIPSSIGWKIWRTNRHIQNNIPGVTPFYLKRSGRWDRYCNETNSPICGNNLLFKYNEISTTSVYNCSATLTNEISKYEAPQKGCVYSFLVEKSNSYFTLCSNLATLEVENTGNFKIQLNYSCTSDVRVKNTYVFRCDDPQDDPEDNIYYLVDQIPMLGPDYTGNSWIDDGTFYSEKHVQNDFSVILDDFGDDRLLSDGWTLWRSDFNTTTNNPGVTKFYELGSGDWTKTYFDDKGNAFSIGYQIWRTDPGVSTNIPGSTKFYLVANGGWEKSYVNFTNTDIDESNNLIRYDETGTYGLHYQLTVTNQTSSYNAPQNGCIYAFMAYCRWYDPERGEYYEYNLCSTTVTLDIDNTDNKIIEILVEFNSIDATVIAMYLFRCDDPQDDPEDNIYYLVKKTTELQPPTFYDDGRFTSDPSSFDDRGNIWSTGYRIWKTDNSTSSNVPGVTKFYSITNWSWDDVCEYSSVRDVEYIASIIYGEYKNTKLLVGTSSYKVVAELNNGERILSSKINSKVGLINRTTEIHFKADTGTGDTSIKYWHLYRNYEMIPGDDYIKVDTIQNNRQSDPYCVDDGTYESLKNDKIFTFNDYGKEILADRVILWRTENDVTTNNPGVTKFYKHTDRYIYQSLTPNGIGALSWEWDETIYFPNDEGYIRAITPYDGTSSHTLRRGSGYMILADFQPSSTVSTPRSVIWDGKIYTINFQPDKAAYIKFQFPTKPSNFPYNYINAFHIFRCDYNCEDNWLDNEFILISTHSPSTSDWYYVDNGDRSSDLTSNALFNDFGTYVPEPRSTGWKVWRTTINYNTNDPGKSKFYELGSDDWDKYFKTDNTGTWKYTQLSNNFILQFPQMFFAPDRYPSLYKAPNRGSKYVFLFQTPSQSYIWDGKTYLITDINFNNVELYISVYVSLASSASRCYIFRCDESDKFYYCASVGRESTSSTSIHFSYYDDGSFQSSKTIAYLDDDNKRTLLADGGYVWRTDFNTPTYTPGVTKFFKIGYVPFSQYTNVSNTGTFSWQNKNSEGYIGQSTTLEKSDYNAPKNAYYMILGKKLNGTIDFIAISELAIIGDNPNNLIVSTEIMTYNATNYPQVLVFRADNVKNTNKDNFYYVATIENSNGSATIVDDGRFTSDTSLTNFSFDDSETQLKPSTGWNLWRTNFSRNENIPGHTYFYKIATGTWDSTNIAKYDDSEVIVLPDSTGWQIWRTDFGVTTNLPGSTYFYKIGDGTWDSTNIDSFDDPGILKPSTGWKVWRTSIGTTSNNPGVTYFYLLATGTWDSTNKASWDDSEGYLQPSLGWQLWRTEPDTATNNPGVTKFYRIAADQWDSTNIDYFDDRKYLFESYGWQIWRTDFDVVSNTPGVTHFNYLKSGIWTQSGIAYVDDVGVKVATGWKVWRTKFDTTTNLPGSTYFYFIGEGNWTKLYFDDKGDYASTGWEIWRSDYNTPTYVAGVTKFYKLGEGTWTKLYFDDEGDDVPTLTGFYVWRTNNDVVLNNPGVTPFYKLNTTPLAITETKYDDQGYLKQSTGWKVWRTTINYNTNVPGKTYFYLLGEGTWTNTNMYFDDSVGKQLLCDSFYVWRTNIDTPTNNPGVTEFYFKGEVTFANVIWDFFRFDGSGSIKAEIAIDQSLDNLTYGASIDPQSNIFPTAPEYCRYLILGKMSDGKIYCPTRQGYDVYSDKFILQNPNKRGFHFVMYGRSNPYDTFMIFRSENNSIHANGDNYNDIDFSYSYITEFPSLIGFFEYWDYGLISPKSDTYLNFSNTGTFKYDKIDSFSCSFMYASKNYHDAGYIAPSRCIYILVLKNLEGEIILQNDYFPFDTMNDKNYMVAVGIDMNLLIGDTLYLFRSKNNTVEQDYTVPNYYLVDSHVIEQNDYEYIFVDEGNFKDGIIPTIPTEFFFDDDSEDYKPISDGWQIWRTNFDTATNIPGVTKFYNIGEGEWAGGGNLYFNFNNTGTIKYDVINTEDQFNFQISCEIDEEKTSGIYPSECYYTFLAIQQDGKIAYLDEQSNNFAQLFDNVHKNYVRVNIKNLVANPKYKSVWIFRSENYTLSDWLNTLDFYLIHIVDVWHQEVGYGIYYDDNGGYYQTSLTASNGYFDDCKYLKASTGYQIWRTNFYTSSNNPGVTPFYKISVGTWDSTNVGSYDDSETQLKPSIGWTLWRTLFNTPTNNPGNTYFYKIATGVWDSTNIGKYDDSETIAIPKTTGWKVWRTDYNTPTNTPGVTKFKKIGEGEWTTTSKYWNQLNTGTIKYDGTTQRLMIAYGDLTDETSDFVAPVRCYWQLIGITVDNKLIRCEVYTYDEDNRPNPGNKKWDMTIITLTGEYNIKTIIYGRTDNNTLDFNPPDGYIDSLNFYVVKVFEDWNNWEDQEVHYIDDGSFPYTTETYFDDSGNFPDSTHWQIWRTDFGVTTNVPGVTPFRSVAKMLWTGLQLGSVWENPSLAPMILYVYHTTKISLYPIYRCLYAAVSFNDSVTITPTINEIKKEKTNTENLSYECSITVQRNDNDSYHTEGFNLYRTRNGEIENFYLVDKVYWETSNYKEEYTYIDTGKFKRDNSGTTINYYDEYGISLPDSTGWKLWRTNFNVASNNPGVTPFYEIERGTWKVPNTFRYDNTGIIKWTYEWDSEWRYNILQLDSSTTNNPPQNCWYIIVSVIGWVDDKPKVIWNGMCVPMNLTNSDKCVKIQFEWTNTEFPYNMYSSQYLFRTKNNTSDQDWHELTFYEVAHMQPTEDKIYTVIDDGDSIPTEEVFYDDIGRKSYGLKLWRSEFDTTVNNPGVTEFQLLHTGVWVGCYWNGLNTGSIKWDDSSPSINIVAGLERYNDVSDFEAPKDFYFQMMVITNDHKIIRDEFTEYVTNDFDRHNEDNKKFNATIWSYPGEYDYKTVIYGRSANGTFRWSADTDYFKLLDFYVVRVFSGWQSDVDEYTAKFVDDGRYQDKESNYYDDSGYVDLNSTGWQIWRTDYNTTSNIPGSTPFRKIGEGDWTKLYFDDSGNVTESSGWWIWRTDFDTSSNNPGVTKFYKIFSGLWIPMFINRKNTGSFKWNIQAGTNCYPRTWQTGSHKATKQIVSAYYLAISGNDEGKINSPYPYPVKSKATIGDNTQIVSIDLARRFTPDSTKIWLFRTENNCKNEENAIYYLIAKFESISLDVTYFEYEDYGTFSNIGSNAYYYDDLGNLKPSIGWQLWRTNFDTATNLPGFTRFFRISDGTWDSTNIGSYDDYKYLKASTGWNLWRTDFNTPTNTPGVTIFRKIATGVWDSTNVDYFDDSEKNKESTGWEIWRTNIYENVNIPGVTKFYRISKYDWTISFFDDENGFVEPSDGYKIWRTNFGTNENDPGKTYFYLLATGTWDSTNIGSYDDSEQIFLYSTGWALWKTDDGENVNDPGVTYFYKIASNDWNPQSDYVYYDDIGYLKPSTGWIIWRTQYNTPTYIPGSTYFYLVANGVWKKDIDIYYDDSGNVPESIGWNIWRSDYNVRINIPGVTEFKLLHTGAWSLFFNNRNTGTIKWDIDVQSYLMISMSESLQTEQSTSIAPANCYYRYMGIEQDDTLIIDNYAFEFTSGNPNNKIVNITLSDSAGGKYWKKIMVFRSMNSTYNPLKPDFDPMTLNYYYVGTLDYSEGTIGTIVDDGRFTSEQSQHYDDIGYLKQSTGWQIWRTDFDVVLNVPGVTRFRKLGEGDWTKLYFDDEGDDVPTTTGWQIWKTNNGENTNIPGVTEFYNIGEGEWDEDEMYFDNEGYLEDSTGWKLWRTAMYDNRNIPGRTRFYLIAEDDWKEGEDEVVFGDEGEQI